MSKVKPRFDKGINLIPENIEGLGGDNLTHEGDLGVDSSDNKLKVYVGTETRSVVTENQSQILTNKIIDVDLNTVSNIEVDNLKNEVLNISITLNGATDSQIPSALATKTMIENRTGVVQQDVNDLITLSGVPANSTNLGTFTGVMIPDDSTIKQALQSLNTNLTSHAEILMDHSEEIQDLALLSGVPIDSTDLGTFTGNTIPDNSTIKQALQALETSNEDKATNAALNDHTSASSDVHGVGVGSSVVGTNTAQTLTNKTLTSPVINSPQVNTPSKLDVKQDTFDNLVTYAITATNGQLVFATDNKKMYQVIDGALSDVGGGGQTLDNLFQLTADEPVGDWTNLSGGFSISKVNPIQGEASYVLDMTNLYAATHKVIPVDEVFRGKTLALTLNYTMEQGAVRVTLLDQTNTIIEGTTFDLALGSGIQKFGTTVFIPSTVTGIRFQMEARATVASQSIKFDNVELSSNLLNSVNIADKVQQVTLVVTNSALTTSTDLNSLPKQDVKGGVELFSLGTSGITLLRDAEISISLMVYRTTASTSSEAIGDIYRNGVRVSGGSSIGAVNNKVTTPYYISANKGDVFTISSTSSADVIDVVTILATARTESIVAPVDQVTERSIAFKFKSTALTDSDPIGTYNTYTYAANTNTKTLAATRPTQTDADMSVNGFQVFTRTYNTASTAAQPVRFEIKIAEPNSMAACDLVVYKDTLKSSSGGIAYASFGAGAKGFYNEGMFNPTTGILAIDGGFTETTNTSAHVIVYNDNSSRTNGYICFTASKLAQAVAIPVPARYPVYVSPPGTVNWIEVNNDGWVRQKVTGVEQSTGANLNASQTINLTVAMRDSLYEVTPNKLGNHSVVMVEGNPNSSSAIEISWRNLNTASSLTTPRGVAEGYGDATAVRAFGANPNYV